MACCLIAIGVLVSRQLARFEDDSELIVRTEWAADSLETLHTAVRDAELNHRSYLISGLEPDLIAFTRASQQLDERLRPLQAIFADQPSQSRRVAQWRSLALQYRDFLDMVLAARRGAGFAAARQLLISTGEIEPFSEMEILLSESIAETRSIIHTRRQQQFAESRAMQRLILLALVLTGVGGLVVTLQVRREVRERRDSEARVRAALHEVDERVRERTSELSQANLHLQRALTDRAEAHSREQLARAAAERANELKDRFLATISHELRTPLNAIVGWAHVLKSGTLNRNDTQRAIEAVDRNARAQAKLIADLLDVSRMTHGRLHLAKSRVDFAGVVSAAVENLRPAAAAKAVALTSAGPAREVAVVGDEGRLQQVVSNLLANALKFTPAEGRIDVELATDGGFAQLRVRDTGEGVDPDVRPQVFDPFYQGQTHAMRSGLGLGLAIVKELVDLHGGSVHVESAGIGAGALFTVRLPLGDATAGGIVRSSPVEAPRPGLLRRLRRRLSSRFG